MDSYFFIPGNKLNKIDSIRTLGVTEIIIDIEDAIKHSEREIILKSLLRREDLKEYYIRIPLYDAGFLNTAIFENLLKAEFKKFVLPKINSLLDFEKILTVFNKNNIKIVLLVETPLFFLEAREVLHKYSKHLTGIGIGSHDFMSEVGGVHTLDNIEYLRQSILYMARAYNIQAIDIASMELENKNGFENEIMDGFKKGYDAKFFIHPWQFSVYQDMKFYNKKDYEWAVKVSKILSLTGDEGEFNPVMIDGQVIERPHLNKMKKILKYYKE